MEIVKVTFSCLSICLLYLSELIEACCVACNVCDDGGSLDINVII